MTNKDITKIYFRGNEIVALYKGDTLIFKKSGVVPPSPTGVYTVRGTLKPDSTAQNIQLCVNGQREQFDVNNDKTFEHTFTNVPVTNMNDFTQSCKDELKTLDLSNFDTSQVTSMTRMFSSCSKLTSLDVSNFNTSKVTNMSSMFLGNWNLTSLDVSNFDTSNVTSMSSMFYLDLELTDLYMNFDNRLNENLTNIFFSCNKLTNVVGKFEGTENDLELDSSPLTPDSAMVFINGLATVTEKRTLSLKASTYDSLTPEQIAIATAKGWTVTRN